MNRTAVTGTIMRAADAENRALKEAIIDCGGRFPDMVLGFGVNYPTKRMLAHVDKGFGPDEIIQSMEICSEGGIRANGNAIVGWNNLTQKDVKELESFMKRLPTGAFYWIYCLSFPYCEPMGIGIQ